MKPVAETAQLYNVRHSGIFNLENLSVSIIGAGGIGSQAALALAKMGTGYLQILDFDDVSAENVGTQLYPSEHISMKKADCLQSLVEYFAPGTEVYGHAEKVDHATRFNQFDLVISCLDSITARQGTWEAVQATLQEFPETAPRYYLDARMAAESFYLYTVDLQNVREMDWYAKLLYAVSDADVVDEPCTSKATYYTASFAAGYIGLMVRLLVTNQPAKHLIVHNLTDHFMLAA